MHYMITARASVGIYLVLDSLQKSGKVLVPGNLCYAAIYPILYAGMAPQFCDVDSITGNVTYETICSAWTSDVKAAILPHMYGNPIEKLPEIVTFLRKKGTIVIEDCASAMGAEAEYPLGQLGDFTVYSMGYAKPLDLGVGGILCSREYDLSPLAEKERCLPERNDAMERELHLFSRLYRVLRNEGSDTAIADMIYQGLPQSCKNLFLHRLDEKTRQWIRSQLPAPADLAAKRRQKLNRYIRNLAQCPIQFYPYASGAVPFRFNFYTAPEKHRPVIDACLDLGIPISDWYPSVLPMFGCKDNLPGVQAHEASILNLPLGLEDGRIDEICRQLKSIMECQEK